jgi:hypothetical protein
MCCDEWSCSVIGLPLAISLRVFSQVNGEATPSYMLGFDTPQWMSGVVPDARIIIILRHPVDRFYSEYVATVPPTCSPLLLSRSCGFLSK